MRKLLVCFFAVLGIVLFPVIVGAQQNPKRYALVIGNQEYTKFGKLTKTRNDANDMEAALRSMGFTVDKVLDGNLVQMQNALTRFKNRLGESKDAYGFFYYSGHGAQDRRGENYLIPADADIPSESYVGTRALSFQTVLDEMSSAENNLNIIVLDACRDFPAAWSKSMAKGLSSVTYRPVDSIIVYATTAGEVAVEDSTSRNSLYTEHLLKHLTTPDLDVKEMFRRVNADVVRASGRKQYPAIYEQYFELAVLNPGSRVVEGQAPPVPRNVRAGTPGTDSVTISWDSAGSGISYKVYYSAQNDPSRAGVLGNLTTGTSMNVKGMNSGINYYFWVASVQNGQESGKSSVVTIKTASVPVNPPTVNNMVRINGGTFTMGSPANELGRFDGEGPQHQVTVNSFYMGKYEVTQKEYQEVMGTNPSRFKGDNLPVENVSWYDAIEYCNARSRKEGLTPAYTIDKNQKDPNNKSYFDNVEWTVTWNRNANGYRLPTEAEWEYACRAGTTTANNTGASITNNTGWYDANSGSTTHPVGQKPANAWGLYDMYGNVREWCWDWDGDYSSGAQTDPVGASSGSHRVGRGGDWANPASSLRSANRFCNSPNSRQSDIGFRVVRPAQ